MRFGGPNVVYVGSFKAPNRLNNQDQRRGSQMTTTSQQLSSTIISQLRMRNKINKIK